MTEQLVIPEFDEDIVQHYSKHAKLLKQTQISKALKFVKYDCIKYLGKDEEFGSRYCFVCLPLNREDHWSVSFKASDILADDEQFEIKVEDACVIYQKKPFEKDYNFSEYKIYKNKDGVFECNCQGWQTRAKRNEMQEDGCNCSHVLALFFAFKLKKFRRQNVLEG